MIHALEKLTELFREFPGIGPRQAKRFVYFLLTRNNAYLEDFGALVKELKKEIQTCAACQRFFQRDAARSPLCLICRDSHRDAALLMAVCRDVDLETIERSRSFLGYYFVLGGSVPILADKPDSRIRTKELVATLKKRVAKGLEEIIIATNLNPEGENTAEYVTKLLAPLAAEHHFKISTLGRGLSTGTELEYSDTETIKSALKNRQ